MADKDEIIQRLARLEEKVDTQGKGIEEMKESLRRVEKDVWTFKVILTLGTPLLLGSLGGAVRKLFGWGNGA